MQIPTNIIVNENFNSYLSEILKVSGPETVQNVIDITSFVHSLLARIMNTPFSKYEMI